MSKAQAYDPRLHEAIRAQVSRSQYEMWFSSLRTESVEEHGVVLSVADHFKQSWLQDNYRALLGEAVKLATGQDTDITILAKKILADDPTPEPVMPPGPSLPTPPPEPHGGRPELNARYRFENFVVGPSNQLSHAASLAVAGAPAGSYNPLFVHGNVGLGKTHLLQAICHRALETRPNSNILYLSSETFVNEFIRAVGQGELDRFRYRYRKVDILLIDDIHMLANKERTQEEFFHTFNTLYNAGRQIVLSSDSPPDEIPSLRERLISRFKWGLVTEIQPPRFETRLAILRRKATDRNVVVPEDVLDYVAQNIDTNIRELEGAIIKTVGHAQLVDRELTLGVAREALGIERRDATRSVMSIDRILNVVCRHFGVRPTDLQGRKRTQSITQPRKIAMFLARKLTPMSLEEIGGHFGGRDHSTVLYGVDTTRKKAAADPTFTKLLAQLEAQIVSRDSERA